MVYSKNPNKTGNTLDSNITTAQLKSSTFVNIIYACYSVFIA